MKKRTGGVATAPRSSSSHGLKAGSPAHLRGQGCAQQPECDKCAETLKGAAGGACAGAEEEEVADASGPACGETLHVVSMTTPVVAGASA